MVCTSASAGMMKWNIWSVKGAARNSSVKAAKICCLKGRKIVALENIGKISHNYTNGIIDHFASMNTSIKRTAKMCSINSVLVHQISQISQKLTSYTKSSSWWSYKQFYPLNFSVTARKLFWSSFFLILKKKIHLKKPFYTKSYRNKKHYCTWYNLNLHLLCLHTWLFLLVSCLSNFSP